MTKSLSVACMNVGEEDSNERAPLRAEEEFEQDIGMSQQLASVNNSITRTDMKQREEILSMDEKKVIKTTAPEYLFGEEDSDQEGSDSPDETPTAIASSRSDRRVGRAIDEGPPDGGLRKDDLIRSISERLASSQPQYEAPAMPYAYPKVNEGAAIPRNRFYLPRAVEAAQRWLITTGGESEDISTFLTGYSEYIGDLGIPVDRVDVGFIMLQPKLSCYAWKWERGMAFQGKEITREQFNERKTIFGRDAPLNVLMDTGATHVRIRASDPSVPRDLSWMRENGYTDYFALPLMHRGQCKGSVAWTTKKTEGFDPDRIQFLEKSMPSLSTVLRSHTSDLVMSQMVGRLQEEVEDRTQELAKANEDLAQANRHVLNQSQAQRRHFAMMSHEIRTPLNGIIGLCSVLDETPLNAEQKDIVQTILSSGDLLQRVVDDVLDYSKLAAGRVEIDMQLVSLSQVLEPVIKSMTTKARQYDITLQTSLDPALPEKLYCDGRRLQQILYNLLGNAIKFSNPGGVVDFGFNGVDTSNGRRIRIIVKDYGKGIAKNHLGMLFQPFHQAHGERNKLYGGTGLGLAITSKLVEALGGNISVDSELARWTEFVVNLPCESGPSSSASAEEAGHRLICKHVAPLMMLQQGSHDSSTASASASVPEAASLKRQATNETEEGTLGTKKQKIEGKVVQSTKPTIAHPDSSESESTGLDSVRILVAEDNKVNQKLIMRVLQRIGATQVDLVENGSKAVDKAKEKEYDLILMDMQMPIMDGLQATRIIKKDRETCGAASPRVVFVSAHALKEIKDQAAEAGAEGFIAKPYNLGQIKEVVVAVAEQLRGKK